MRRYIFNCPYNKYTQLKRLGLWKLNTYIRTLFEVERFQFSLDTHSFSEIRCPEPVLAEHSILSVTGNDRMYGRTLIRTAESTNVGATSYKIGALAKYRCERGYKVIGEPLSTCEDSGQWSGDVPQCVCKYLLLPRRKYQIWVFLYFNSFHINETCNTLQLYVLNFLILFYTIVTRNLLQ